MSTFLIVDDHASFRRQARALLEAGGHSVVGEAANGLAAVAAAADLRPDAILLDVSLPDIDGFEVARRVRAEEPAARVILTSSRDATAYGPRLECAPAVGFVTKEELSGSVIDALLSGMLR